MAIGRCISFHLILFSLISFNITTSSATLIQDLECSAVNCGEGTCIASNTSLLRFDCQCKTGWKKMQIGPLTFPSCVVPNCTLNFGCGNGALPPPPPPPAIPPPFNISNPCNLIWCGDGTCVANGTGHSCQCHEGSENLFDQTGFACFKQCYLGADCVGLGIGSHPPPPPGTSSGSGGNGSNQASNCSRNLHTLVIVVLSATVLRWR